MSEQSWPRALVRVAVGGALALGLDGCSYDYLQHNDRIAYSAGDAVHANLEAETINPSKHSMYVTSGLGKNGSVMPTSGGTTTTTTSPPAN